jgi:hypothetical protein
VSCFDKFGGMKIKLLIIAALVVQLGALLIVVVQAVEPRDAIEIGLSKLKDNCPTQALTITNAAARVWRINTAGDYFFMARDLYQSIIKVLCFAALINVCLLIAIFISVRKSRISAPLK